MKEYITSINTLTRRILATLLYCYIQLHYYLYVASCYMGITQCNNIEHDDFVTDSIVKEFADL